MKNYFETGLLSHTGKLLFCFLIKECLTNKGWLGLMQKYFEAQTCIKVIKFRKHPFFFFYDFFT